MSKTLSLVEAVPAMSSLGAVSLVIYGAFLVILIVATKQRYFSPISGIPGPFSGTVGTFFQVWHIFKGRIDFALQKLHREHGPFVRISYNEVSICHPEAVQVLAAPLWKAPFYDAMAVPNSSYITLMSERNPKKFSQMRSYVGSAFTFPSVIKNESVMDEAIELMKSRLDDISQQQSPVELGPWLHFLTYDILGETLFSKRFGFLDQGRDVGGSIKNNFYLSLYITSILYMQWLHALLFGSPILRWLDFQPSEHTYNTALEGITARRADSESKIDMMEHWLLQYRKKPDLFTLKDLTGNVTMTLGAGGGTVGSVLEAFFYFLLKNNPKYMQRLHEEVDKAQLSPIVSYAEAQKLSFLQAVIKETLRFWPPVPWNLPRVVSKEGLTVAGQRFESGTVLSVNPWLIHRDKDCFGPDAEEYNPERWLADPDAVQKMERYLIPFGLGYNSCPGRHVANIELSKITATLIRDFDFRLANPEAEWKYHQLFVTSQSNWPVFIKRRT